jgi:nicotinamidase-related amidase
MATIREGNKSVLLVVDVQVGVVRDAWNAPEVIGNIVQGVEKARSNGVPVVWVQHGDEELIPNSPNWQLVPELKPMQGEPRIYKKYNSSFEETPLEEELSRLGVAHILLAGAATNWCIRATAYGALDRGYDVTLIKDAHTTGTMESENGITINAETVIEDLNVAMSWLTYPGRKNKALSIKDIDFS